MGGAAAGRGHSRGGFQHLLMVGARDLAATGGAGAAGLDAVFHVAQRLAVLFAGLAHLGAQSGEAGVKLAFAPERIGGEGAQAGAIEHQAQMLGPGMLPAHLQAMGHGHGGTDGMAMLCRRNGVFGQLAEIIHGPLPGRFALKAKRLKGGNCSRERAS